MLLLVLLCRTFASTRVDNTYSYVYNRLDVQSLRQGHQSSSGEASVACRKSFATFEEFELETRDRGLFVGRVQPFHKGHLQTVGIILQQVKEIIVGIAFAEQNFTFDNPFSCGERVEMIWRALDGEIRSRALIIPIRNQEDNRLWPSYAIQYLPSFDVAYTNNRLQQMLLEQEDVHVQSLPWVDRKRLAGSLIRRRMADGVDWEHLVPSGTRDFLVSIHAAVRVRRLARLEEA